MIYYLFPQIFMSSIQQTLVDLSSNKLYILFQLPGNNLNLSNKVSTETHFFSPVLFNTVLPIPGNLFFVMP